jgi:uncharacterized heparinase superfamily protein
MAWAGPQWRARSLEGPFEFRFAERSRVVQSAQDWQSSDVSDLWLYNLHYFDDLNAAGADDRTDWHRDWLQRWIIENPVGCGRGWDPYPTSLRIVNWVRWALRGGEVSETMLASLAIQARWLERRLETHLLGNHLWSNAKALCFIGVFFEGAEAQGWLSRGLHLLKQELCEQCLSDGGHFERSPMYHGLFLEDVLDLLHLAQLQPSLFPSGWISNLEETSGRMMSWMRQLIHADGDIAFFNDATLGICPSFNVLRRYRSELVRQALEGTSDNSGLTHLRASGFVRLQSRQALILADVGSVGPDHLPGHAHAGTLSFELSVGSHRMIVNGGVSVYGADAERQRQRSTRAHSTLVIDGENSSEVWAGFRVARRARVLATGSGQSVESLCFHATHDGYRRLKGAPLHKRTWTLRPQDLVIDDEIVGRGQHEIEIIFHLAPCWQVRPEGENQLRLTRVDSGEPNACDIKLFFLTPFLAEIVQSTWHPGFGVNQLSQSIVLRATVQLPMRNLTRIEWRPAA